MNVPVAIIALVLIAWSRPVTDHQPARIDYRGLVLIASGVALSVLGFQQSQVWGWTNPATGLCIAVGLALLVVFYFVEKRTPEPLMQVSIFRIRAFSVENLVLGVAMLAFIPRTPWRPPSRTAERPSSGPLTGPGGPSHSAAGMDRPVSAVPDCLGSVVEPAGFPGLARAARPGECWAGGRLTPGGERDDDGRGAAGLPLDAVRGGAVLLDVRDRQPASSMVADGGSACVDVRWYCQDTRSCTERWTARRERHAQGSAGAALADTGYRRFGGAPTGPSPAWQPTGARAGRGLGSQP